MNLKGLTKTAAYAIFLIIVLAPTSALIAEAEQNNKAEVSQELLSIYFRAFSFVLNRIEDFNMTLDTNLSIPRVCCLDIELNETMSLGELLNISYSLALEANMLVSEGNYSDACSLIKKALNLLKSVLASIHKNQKLNLTATPVGAMIRLQVAFERHKRLLTKINLSIQRLENVSKLNITLVNQLYLNISTMLDEGSRLAMHNASQAAKILSEASKVIADIKKEIVESSQIAKVEEMFNRTLSKLNLTATPEGISSMISNLTEEFNRAKSQGDVKKAKEVLKEIKKAVARAKKEIKVKAKQKGVKGSKPPEATPPPGENSSEAKGKNEGESKGKGKG